jgi:putative transport protein
MLTQVIDNPIAALFLIVALGTFIGQFRVSSISLGSSGVLFAGLLFGHLGVELPRTIESLGIILFVYAVGLQAGPRFFNQFRQRGVMFAMVAMVVVGVGAATTWSVTRLLEIDPVLAIGMYAGAMTSTPGLAAATDVASDPRVGVGYGVAYPLGVIAVVLFVQLLPRILKIDLRKEEKRLAEQEPKAKKLERRQFRISNPACVGKTLAELQIQQISEINITRISRDDKVYPARRHSTLELGDVILAVGRAEELDKLVILFGEEIHGEAILESTDVVARDAVVSTDEMAGKALSELQLPKNWGVVVSRVFREDLNFVPTADYVLDVGDLIRVTGSREEVERFVATVGQQEKRIHETNIPSLALGIFLGVLLAYKEFSLPGGISFRLGLAGGPLLVSLVLAHFGRIGRFNIRTPRGAKYIMQQLGLVLFLASAGTAAGSALGSVIRESGASLLLAGFLVTTVAALSGLLFAHFYLRQDLLTVLGSISGAMTSTPALGALGELSDRSEPIFAYSGVYPVALILITALCQLLYYLL